MISDVFQDNVVEAPEEASKKVKLFFAYAADRWDAQFYAKANDNIYVSIGKLVKLRVFYSRNLWLFMFLGLIVNMDNVVDCDCDCECECECHASWVSNIGTLVELLTEYPKLSWYGDSVKLRSICRL